MARLFFAVALASDLAQPIAALQEQLVTRAGAGALRLALPRQAHYTLRFLGEQPPARRDAAVRAAPLAARAAEPFDLAPDALGVFDDERRAHTLWIGAGRGRAELSALNAELERALAQEWFAPEARAFAPHMTLARTRRRLPPAIVRSLLAICPLSLESMRVSEFSLFESRSGPNGAMYLPLETFRLGS